MWKRLLLMLYQLSYLSTLLLNQERTRTSDPQINEVTLAYDTCL